jgi:mRNA interferase MazF
MGHYSRGDIVIAPVAMDQQSGTKTRPALVIGIGGHQVFLCPISSRPPTDAPCVPVSLDDFSEGGLDLFGESYVLVSRVLKIHPSGIIGKKGRLSEETVITVMSLVDRSRVSDHAGMKTSRRPGSWK